MEATAHPTLTTDHRGRLTLGSLEADLLLTNVIRNAAVLARECERVFFVWVGQQGLSVHDRKPFRPYVEVLPGGATTFRGRAERVHP